MITQQHGRALGTNILLTIRTNDDALARVVLTKLRIFLHGYEQRFSRFLSGSELTRHNHAAGNWSQASLEFIAFARVSNAMQNKSEGLYNPFVLPDLQRAGYIKSLAGSHGVEAELWMTDRHANYATARVELTDGMVAIPAGTAFDTGGLGKGYALDQMADIIENAGIQDYWVSLGGDIIGRGCDESGKAWQVELDMIQARPFVSLDNTRRTAVATSSILKRRGKGWHHLIDPRTGRPAITKFQTVSVVARSGIEADVYAKSILIANDAELFPDADITVYTNMGEKDLVK